MTQSTTTPGHSGTLQTIPVDDSDQQARAMMAESRLNECATELLTLTCALHRLAGGRTNYCGLVMCGRLDRGRRAAGGWLQFCIQTNSTEGTYPCFYSEEKRGK